MTYDEAVWRDAQQVIIDRILGIHFKVKTPLSWDGPDYACDCCGEGWPCMTAMACGVTS
jgi:hypothetical protein